MFIRKAIFIFCIVLFMQHKANAQTSALKWYTFEEMQLAQKTQPKKVIVDYYADWCYWCKKIDENTLQQKNIAHYINTHYYLVKLKPEADKNIIFKGKTYSIKTYNYTNSSKTRKVNELAVKLINVDFIYPSLVFLDEQLNVITVFNGYKTPQELDPIVTFFASNSYKTNKWAVYQKKYTSILTP